MTDPAPARSVEMSTGALIPLIGLGTWQMKGDEARRAVGWALEAGYRHLDTATIYGNEAEVGDALRDSGLPRDEVFVTTKLPPERAGKARQTLEASLAALGVEAVDLWLIHWPPDGSASPKTWERMLEAHRDGLARAVGVSNYGPQLVDELISATGVAPAVNQVKWSPTRYDRARLEHSLDRGVVLEGYSPFRAGGLDSPVLTELAERHGVTPAQIVVRWHVQTGVVVIPKSAQRERIVRNADIEGFSLSDDDLAAIESLAGSR
jgi:2,5-diketo-D-gluconate reductase A